MKLLNLNVGIKLDNSKDVINLINKDTYDIVTLQEIMKKIDNGVFDLYNSGNIIKDNTKYSYEYFGPLWFANHHEKKRYYYFRIWWTNRARKSNIINLSYYQIR